MLVDSRPSVYGYGDIEAERYQTSAHGPDGKLLLDPHINSFIETIGPDTYVIDVGAGAAPFSIGAARRGAFVAATDNSRSMVERAKKAVEAAGFSDRVAVFINHTRSLPFTEGSFDTGMSINVGCNLDSDTLNAHFRELRRVLTEDGTVLFTTPINLGTVFTDGSLDAHGDLLAQLIEIESRLKEGAEADQGFLQNALGGLDSIRRATLVIRDGGVRLVDDRSDLPLPLAGITIPESEIEEGESIWRKIPGLVVPNRYHSIEAYESRMYENGFAVERQSSDGLDLSEVNTYNFNSSPRNWLGREYINKSPFVVYVLRPIDIPAQTLQ